MIDQVYPDHVRAEFAEFVAEGPFVVAERPGAGAAALVLSVAADAVLLRVRDSATHSGFRVDFARALVRRAAEQASSGETAASMRPPVAAVLATQFGRRAIDVLALADGHAENDVTVADLAGGVPPQTVVVLDQAQLLDTIVGREALWAFRDLRHVVLVTRPWFVKRLRQEDAPFFGHGRTVDLSAFEIRPPLGDPDEIAFVAERTQGNAQLAVEVLQRGDGDVRQGWKAAVDARLAIKDSWLNAAFAIHRFGPRLLYAIAHGQPPYRAIPDGSSARIATALRALRDHDFVYPPEPRRWRLTDAAMAAALRIPADKP